MLLVTLLLSLFLSRFLTLRICVCARLQNHVRRDLDLMDGVHALTGMVDARLQLWLHGEPLAPDLPERIVSLFFHGVAS